jgi:hypothetical protein
MALQEIRILSIIVRTQPIMKSAKATTDIDIQTERWPIECLIPRVNNPRADTREQVANIGASIPEFGFTCPIMGWAAAHKAAVAGVAKPRGQRQ